MRPGNNNSPSNGLYRWVAILLAVLTVAFGSLAFKLYSGYRQQRNEISDINSQIMSDAACRREFKNMEIPSLIDYLQYVHRLDPHFENRTLDVVAKNEKREMASDIIRELARRTGDNLGDNPDAWFQKYRHDSTNASVKGVSSEK